MSSRFAHAQPHAAAAAAAAAPAVDSAPPTVQLLLTHAQCVCCICLRRGPSTRRQPHVCTPATAVDWSVALGVVVTPGARVCDDCWRPRSRVPRWTDNLAAGTFSYAKTRTAPADACALSTALAGAWERIRELQERVHKLETQLRDAPIHATSPPLPPPPPPPFPCTFEEVLLNHAETLTAFTGAPSRQSIDELVAELQKPPLAPWTRNAVSLRSAVLMALCHLRLRIPMRAFPGLFGCSLGTVHNGVHGAFAALEALSMSDAAGAVRFLTDQEINDTMPQRVREHMPDLKLIADCTSVFVERPSDLDLVHLLFDGEQYSGTWVKYFIACAPSGYVMHVSGPYAPAGRAADGRILPYALMANDDFREFAQRGGVWLADYGFRGSKVPEGVELRLPRRGAEGEQMTADDNDFNREITRLRWLIEADNNRLKTFRYFRDVLSWKEIPNVKQYMTVACFLFNRWHQPLLPTGADNDE